MTQIYNFKFRHQKADANFAPCSLNFLFQRDYSLDFLQRAPECPSMLEKGLIPAAAWTLSPACVLFACLFFNSVKIPRGP